MAEARANKLAVVTGASGGIGYELARLLATDGYDLLLAARSGDRLNSIAADFQAKHHVQVTPVVVDLSQPHTATAIEKSLDRIGPTVDVLINNAGIGAFGRFHEQPLDRILDILQINIVALTELTRLLLPRMVAAGRGHVMNVASTAAFQPGPLMAVYYASKAYVLHLSEALVEELRESGISVTALCPGPTKTGFEESADMRDSKLFKSGRVMTAEQVAQVGYQGMWDRRPVVIPGFTNQFLAWATRLPPRPWLAKIARWSQEKSSA
jgi:uncharacterized protein